MHNRYDERNGERMRSARGRDDGYHNAGRGGYEDERAESWRGSQRENAYEMERGQGARGAYSHDYDRDYGSGSNYGRGYGDYASGMNAGREYGTSTNYGREDYNESGRRYGQGRDDYGSDRDYADRLSGRGYGSGGREERYGGQGDYGQDRQYGQYGQSGQFRQGGSGYGASAGGYARPYGEDSSRDYGASHYGGSMGGSRGDYYGRGGSMPYNLRNSAGEDRYDAYGRSMGQMGQSGYAGQQGQSGMESQRGRGPKGYARSDERIREDLCERLSDDVHIDASDITVEVKDGTVTLSGNVDERGLKHRAEDIADACSGVKDVQNRLTVKQQSAAGRNGGGKNENKNATGTASGSTQKH